MTTHVHTSHLGTIIKDDDGRIHCGDGPAIIEMDGTRYWAVHGKLHREDGPAVVFTSGDVIWYLNNKPMNFDKFCTQLELSEQERLVLMIKYGIIK